MYAALLAARMSGRLVTIAGLGTCTNNSNVEDISDE
jgi:hypothetical protein